MRHYTLAAVNIKFAAKELCQHLADIYVGFTKLGNDLIRCVTFLRHSASPFRAVRPSKILSLTMVQFYWGEVR